MSLAQLVPRVLLAVLLFLPFAAQGQELHEVWNTLLASHVQAGRVDYLGFKQDEDKLTGYLAQLDRTQPDDLAGPERLAFYINAYNAYTVKLILENFRDGRPVKSIKNIGGLFSSPWSIRFARVGGATLTLDNIEHDIIRPQFKDPRVHFALNCAARSCPPLRGEAYTGRELERQLDDSVSAFLNKRENTSISGNILYVSKIFDWYAADFHGDISGFVTRYARGELLAAIRAAGGGLRVKYLPYDWSLNGG